MPVYEYRCDNGHTFEVMQRMSDDPVAECGTCGSQVQRVFHPVAVHFKGSGFYNTDYGKAKRGSNTADEQGAKDSSAKDDSKPGAGKPDSAGDQPAAGAPSSDSKNRLRSEPPA